MSCLHSLLRNKVLPLALVLLGLAQMFAQQAPAQQGQAAAPEAEHHITQAEARELFREVDRILGFASEQTGLPIQHTVKKKLATREQVANYVAKRLKEQGSDAHFERSALPLKKLGLLPRDFNLREYILGLYKEQVEGWYDAHNKTVYLLDWVDPDVQKPVMAHELVHALQDQNFGLDNWLNVAHDSNDDSTQIALEEQRVARQSVVEGQAMVVLYDYQLAPTGQSVQSAPDAVDSMKGSVTEGQDATPMYAHAPIYLREALLFPYTYGTDFVRVLLTQRGKQAAFAGVFQHPPADTRQIMEPDTYLAANPAAPAKAAPSSDTPSKQSPSQPAPPWIKVVPLEHVLGPQWKREDLSGLGEIDLRILLQQWGGKEPAARLAGSWRGGYYMSLSRKNAPSGEPVALALILRFDSADSARQFAGIYESALPTRYSFIQPAQIEPAFNQSHPWLRQWSTNEGLISLYTDDTTVIALESFAAADAAKLHAALAPVAPAQRAPSASIAVQHSTP